MPINEPWPFLGMPNFGDPIRRLLPEWIRSNHPDLGAMMREIERKQDHLDALGFVVKAKEIFESMIADPMGEVTTDDRIRAAKWLIELANQRWRGSR
jgi:hypothetical protein